MNLTQISLLLLLLFAVIVVAAGCIGCGGGNKEAGYTVEGNSVVFRFKNHYEEFWFQKQKCKSVDAATFEVLKETDYGKDKQYAYHRGLLIEGADASSFEVLHERYRISKDRKNVFFREKLLSKDAVNFKIIAKKHAVDAKNVYLLGGQKDVFTIEGADPNSFQPFEYSYDMFTDKNHIYRGTKKIEGVRSSDIKILTHTFWKTKDKVFRGYTPVEGVNAKDFEILSKDYSKDDKYVFYRSKAIPNCDPTNARMLRLNSKKQDIFLRTGNDVFCRGQQIQGARGISFKLLPSPGNKNEFSNFSLDRERVYYMSTPLKGADPKTFEIIPEKNMTGNYISRDARQVYYKSDVIQGASRDGLKSFYSTKNEVSPYWRDKNRVYYKNRVLEEADPKTFKVEGREVGSDGKNRFYRGEIASGRKKK